MEKKSGSGPAFLLREAHLPFETVILIIAGMTMLLAGALLLPIYQGVLPYSENGFHGLLLIIFALQMIILGKTPIGNLPRSKPLFVFGIMIAATGMVTCFIPLSTPFPRVLLFSFFGPGSLILLFQMIFDRDKFRKWATYRGIFWHLIFGCTLVYVLSILIAIILWRQNLMRESALALAVVSFGAAILYLAGVLWRIYQTHPEAQTQSTGDIDLTADQAMLILMGVFMIILGALLIPVNMGLLPFSASAQLGLLMIIFAVQMLAFGNTPVGPFTRTWLVVGLGLLFAAVGIVSCIIPGLLVSTLTVLVGGLNLLGGVIALTQLWARRPWQTRLPPILSRLFSTQFVLNLLAIVFGVSMLIPGLVPGTIIGVILAANGGVLLYLLHILIIISKMQAIVKNDDKI